MALDIEWEKILLSIIPEIILKFEIFQTQPRIVLSIHSTKIMKKKRQSTNELHELFSHKFRNFWKILNTGKRIKNDFLKITENTISFSSES